MLGIYTFTFTCKGLLINKLFCQETIESDIYCLEKSIITCRFCGVFFVHGDTLVSTCTCIRILDTSVLSPSIWSNFSTVTCTCTHISVQWIWISPYLSVVYVYSLIIMHDPLTVNSWLFQISSLCGLYANRWFNRNK